VFVVFTTKVDALAINFFLFSSRMMNGEIKNMPAKKKATKKRAPAKKKALAKKKVAKKKAPAKRKPAKKRRK